MNESNYVFTEFSPPTGGLHRLQKTLKDRQRRTNSRTWRFAAGAIAASVLTVAWLLPGMVAQHRQTERLRDAMREVVVPLDSGLHVVNGVALELPSRQSNVKIFLVQLAPVSSP